MGDLVPFAEGPAPFRRDGLGYVYEPKESGIRFRVDFLKRHGEEMHGVLTVETTRPGVTPHLHEANHNFGSLTARTALAKHLTAIDEGVPWRQYLESFCVSVMRREREGEPFEAVGDLPEHPEEVPQLGLLLPYRRITWLFGEEGSGKGTLAVGWMCAIASGLPWLGHAARQGHVAYLDWEDDGDTMDRRIKACCRGMDIDPPTRFLYRHCSGPLHNQVNAIARQFDALEIDAYVVDSAVLAAGIGGDRGDSADTAHGLVEGLRILNRTVLVIDHVSKASTERSGPAKPYGSVMKRAWARQAWEVKKDQEPGDKSFSVGLYHNKNNHGALEAPIGIGITWSDAGRRVDFKKQDIHDSPKLIEGASITTQIERLLLHEPGLGIEEIARELGARPDTVSRTLRRYMGNRFVSARGGWACAHQEYAS